MAINLLSKVNENERDLANVRFHLCLALLVLFVQDYS